MGSSLGMQFGDGFGVLQVPWSGCSWLTPAFVPQDLPQSPVNRGCLVAKSQPCVSSAPPTLLSLLSITGSLLGQRRNPALCSSPASLPGPHCAVRF